MRTTAFSDDNTPGSLHEIAYGPQRHSLAAIGRRLFGTLLAWQDRANQRYRLSELNSHLLRDIGLSQRDVGSEVRKPFWLD